MRITIAFLMIAGLTTLTTGCGVRGPLEPPPGAQVKTGDGLVKKEQQPDRPFILDRLL